MKSLARSLAGGWHSETSKRVRFDAIYFVYSINIVTTANTIMLLVQDTTSRFHPT